MTTIVPIGNLSTAQRISQRCGLLAIVLGAVVLVGLAFGIETLTRIAPGLSEMQALMATALIGAGFSLLLLRPASLTADRILGRWIGLGVALLGFVAAAESPATALALFTIGLALWGMDRGGPSFRREQFTLAAIWAVVIPVLVGDAYTAVILAVIAVGISFLRPERGPVGYLLSGGGRRATRGRRPVGARAGGSRHAA